jgi:signal transduction histidine kinase
VKTLHFKTNTLLKNLVGKDLINDDSIAVIELVKNAYDARSPEVTIRVEELSESGTSTTSSRILISDSGRGMNENDIVDKWLNIAYSEKKDSKREHGTFYAGNKGIGRFSCDRLGETLDLLTRRSGGPILHLRINWPDFEVAGKQDLTIQQIDIKLRTLETSEAREIAGRPLPRTGTTLVISSLRSVWDRERLLELKRRLERFMNPNQMFAAATFAIELQVPDLLAEDEELPPSDQLNGTVHNQIFSKLEFGTTYIEVEISPNGNEISTHLFHQGDEVFRLVEKNTFGLKNLKAVFYYLNPYKKAYFKRQTGMRSIDFGSVFLFLNGFRIAPYGDRGDDWLGFDSRQGQGRARFLGSRDLIGRIEITDEEEAFTPISSREGLKNSDAFIELKERFALDVVRRLERFVVDGLSWDSIPDKLRDSVKLDEGLDWQQTSEEYVESWDKKRRRIALSIMTFIGSNPDRIISFWFNPSLLQDLSEQRADEVKSLLAKVDSFQSSQVEPGLRNGVNKLKRLLKEREAEALEAKSEAANLQVTVAEQSQKLHMLRRQADTYQAQTLFMQSVTSLDTKSLIAYHHEIALNANIVSNYLSKCVRLAKEGSAGSQLVNALEKIALANKRILAIAQFATKANFKSASQKELTDIPAFVEQYVVNVARDFIASGLRLDVFNKVGEPFEIKLRRIELSILIDNIISNAAKAQARSVQITVELIAQNTLQLSFVDDGRGLTDSIVDPQQIFNLGVTTTAGSGLGLYHAKEIVTALGGTITALPRKQKGLEIRITVMR